MIAECLRVVRYDLDGRIWERTDGDEVRGTRVGSGAGGRADHDNVGRARYGCATVTAISHTAVSSARPAALSSLA